MGIILCQKDGWILENPKNSWDMNYHLINEETLDDHLIDIGDVYDEGDEGFGEEGLNWETLKTLSDIEECLTYAWKVI